MIGPKARRTEVVTVRLDPRLRYLAELAARSQRRTVSGLMEWALKNELGRVGIDPVSAPGQSVHDVAAMLWDPDPDVRLERLAAQFPHLMTYDEEVQWKQRKEGRGND